jgi:hypothetical protein
MTDTAGPRTESRDYSAVQRWLDGFSDLSVRSKAAILLMMQERETAIEVKARLTRDQDAAVLALYDAGHEWIAAKSSILPMSAPGGMDTHERLSKAESRLWRVLSDHSAAADEIRERVERETRDGR